MVLAASINLDAVAVAGKIRKNCVKVVSDGYEMSVVPLDDLEKKKEEAGTSAGLIRGVLAGLRSRGISSGRMQPVCDERCTDRSRSFLLGSV